MASLAIFDFDRTIVNEDSDATIINRLREKQPPPEWEASNHDWTPYMSDVFEHAFAAGLNQDDILGAIGSMRPTPGMQELITTLAEGGWDVLVLTDANIYESLRPFLDEEKCRQCVPTPSSSGICSEIVRFSFQEHITAVITNCAFWKNGRLFIEPCMQQAACARCPSNLCKSLALAQWCAGRPPYQRVVYAGDGRNDFCPATNMPAHATVFPRKGYPMEDLIKKTLASPSPQVSAQVVPWENAYTILEELFPGRLIPM
ncbi:Pyridoxal phosphate phosphatase PH [Operophtera brumata]|uniref:Pyridoxal phosphate phosphatase PH n=1 Tax=Operophtera brumata TaxID=104452 RepID=A0A0L7KSZ1_OPEBR|nr:Pyridoxal phosphate phosphatase PH [Operophtera brumata]